MLLAGHAVEQREDHRVLPHQRGRQLHGLVQGRHFHGEEQQLSLLAGVVRHGKVTLASVAPGPFLLQARQPLSFRNKAHMARPQRPLNQIAI